MTPLSCGWPLASGRAEREMNGRPPRVAFFPDSFHEVNGVAHTSRHFEQFARKHNLPFFCVRAGPQNQGLQKTGNLWTLELPRCAFSIPLEKDLGFDPVYLRHVPRLEDAIEDFAPDIIHITGPSDIGLLGASLARHYSIPLAASWHTNVHEYAGRRFSHLLRMFSEIRPVGAALALEDCAMKFAADFYSAAEVLFAPSQQLCAQLKLATGRPCFLMRRGIDCKLFNPSRRRRPDGDKTFILGYVGRLSAEKNVRLLAQIQRELKSSAQINFRFVIVGHGTEEAWLRRNLPGAVFTGVLRGEALANAFADMDLFVFPSHTDTFGNVVLEAMASGVPGIVTEDGGPSTIVSDGETGRITDNVSFTREILNLLRDSPTLAKMRRAARTCALSATWDSIFEEIYARYMVLLCKFPRLQ